MVRRGRLSINVDDGAVEVAPQTALRTSLDVHGKLQVQAASYIVSRKISGCDKDSMAFGCGQMLTAVSGALCSYADSDTRLSGL